MPNYRLPNKGAEFDHFRFFCKNAPNQYKTEIEPPHSKAGYNVQKHRLEKDLLVLHKEKEIKKISFDPTRRLDLLQ